MVRVDLFFDSFKDESFSDYNIIRLKCGVQFQTPEGWSQPYSAIIDTGAHTSVLPLSLWKSIMHQKIKDYKIYGLSKKEECSLNGTIGKITLMIVDQFGNQTQELEAFAFLAGTDQIPVIIGFNSLLEKFNVHFDFRKNIAYAEE